MLQDAGTVLLPGRAPLLAGRAPLLARRAPLLARRAPLLGVRAPLLARRAPLLGVRAPLLAGRGSMEPMAVRTIRLEAPLDLVGTLRPLFRGSGDPTMRLSSRQAIRASATPAGPATLSVVLEDDFVRAEAWGPGGAWSLELLPAFLGLDDRDSGFEPWLHPVVGELARRHAGLRLGRTGLVWDALVPAILEQKITGTEAFRAYRRLVLAHGVPAPGPSGGGPMLGMRVAPAPDVVAALPSWSFPPLGIEPRRGSMLRRMAADGRRLDALAGAAGQPGGGGAGVAVLAARLRAYPGIGPWTAAEVTLRALGDPDAVSVGDAHLPHRVAWVLAREPRATDERMLELLEPWRGHRARVVRLLESSGISAPRYGPRLAPRDLSRL